MPVLEPFRITVNEHHHIALTPEQAGQLNIIAEGDGVYHILSDDGTAYRATVLQADYATRTFALRINGHAYSVHIGDHYERLAEQLGLSAGGGAKAGILKAPMPGLVLNILVAPGQTVQKGEALLILEAMKMENVLKAQQGGTVKSIAVLPGAPVEKGQLLLEME